MRRIIESTRVSLDGVIGDLQAWGMPYLDLEAQHAAAKQLSVSDAMLMGRHTYEVLAAAWSGRTGEFADRINGVRKYVFSSTLEHAAWHNSTIVGGDVVAEVARLKQDGDRDLVIYGHGPLGQALIEHGLLDELRLSVHPLVVGRGTLLFRDGPITPLQLASARTLANGVVVLTYRTLRAEATDARESGAARRSSVAADQA
jgi:dihydrofolate reductase